MISTALQSIRTKASEQSEAWLKAQRRWSFVWWEFVLVEFASLPPSSAGVNVPTTVQGFVCWGVVLHHHRNLLYGIREYLCRTTGVTFFSVIFKWKCWGKNRFREVAPNLQTSVDSLDISECSTHVSLFLHMCILFGKAALLTTIPSMPFEGPLAASLPNPGDFLILILTDLLTLLP